MQNLIIRKAIKVDLEAIVDLWWRLSVFADELSVKSYLKDEKLCRKECYENFERSITWSNYCYIVAEVDSVVVGFMLASISNCPQKSKYSKMALINNLIVKDGFRNKGICRAMYEQIETFARDNGASYIDVSTEFKNVDAIKVYRNLGFAENKVDLQKWL